MKKTPHRKVNFDKLRVINYELTQEHPGLVKGLYICDTCRMDILFPSRRSKEYDKTLPETSEASREEPNYSTEEDCCQEEKQEEEERRFLKIKALATILDVKIDAKNFKNRVSYQKKIHQLIQNSVNNLFPGSDITHEEDNCPVLAKAVVSHRR